MPRTEKRAVKKVIGSLGMLAAGIPGFAAAILLLMVFSVKLKWFPSSGLFSFSTLYFTGYGIVALSDGCDHPNDRTCIG
mgnify:CR=1 FL=1